MMEGNPIEVMSSAGICRGGGAVDWSDPMRLRVLDSKEVGDRSRLLSSSVRVRGRLKGSVTA